MEQGVGEVVEGIAHTGSTRVYDVNRRAAVVLEGGAEIVATLAVGGPRGARVRGVVGYY